MWQIELVLTVLPGFLHSNSLLPTVITMLLSVHMYCCGEKCIYPLVCHHHNVLLPHNSLLPTVFESRSTAHPYVGFFVPISCHVQNKQI